MPNPPVPKPAILSGGSLGPITVSVVSHDQGGEVAGLLGQLHTMPAGRIARVILTHNLPEAAPASPPGGWAFALTRLINPKPKGFGANHNAALTLCETPAFCVLNPDVGLPDPLVWDGLLEALSVPGVGCAYPVLVDAAGAPQDHERSVPTPATLWRRHVLGHPDLRREWVGAAFWLLRTDAFRAVGGFDERYFMYCEDTDACLRLQLAGWSLARAARSAVHAGRRRSRRDPQHLAWHLGSLWRLWTGPVLRQWRAARPA